MGRAPVLIVPGGASGPPVIDPATLSPYAWWDAQSITPQADDTDLTTWPDISGNGRDLSQATAANKPHYRAVGIGGKPSVQLAVASHFMDASVTLAQPYTLAAVISHGVNTVNKILTAEGASNPFTGTDAAGDLRWSSGTVLTGGRIADIPRVLILAYNGASTVRRIDTVEATVNPGTTGHSSTLRLGGASGAWVGYVGELILFPTALTSGQRDDLHDYFRSRW